MATIRDPFVDRFGEDCAAALEDAAVEHSNGTNSDNKGTDPFKWVLLITIGYECWSHDGYRDYHGITAPAEQIREWIKQNADLGSHDGDCDYVTALAGGYAEYMPGRSA